MDRPDYYVAPIDGQPCMRIAGRFRRHRFPLAAVPPADPGPRECFFCHPENDPLYQSAWGQDPPLSVLGNAFPIADRAWLVAPPGAEYHTQTPATLPRSVLRQMLPVALDPAFLSRFQLDAMEVVSFWNTGVSAAQSKRHPHLQIVGFEPHRRTRSGGNRDGVLEDIEMAAAEGRALELGATAVAIVPRAPSMTAEIWVPRGRTPEGADELRADESPANESWADESWTDAVAVALRACERRISGNYNLIIRHEPSLIRIVPRGISERAGLELSCPQVVGSVVAASVAESIALWSEALKEEQ